LKDKDEYIRQAAARALGKLKDKRAVEPLIGTLKDPEVNVRTFSAWALGEIQDSRAIEPLCSSLFDKETKVRDQSFEALRKFREPTSRKIMVNALIKGAKINSSASGTLWKLISLEGKEVILRAVEDPQGDKAKTLRNYIDLMEANIQNISDIGTKALVDYPDRGMVISELANYITSQTGTPTQSLSMLGRLKDPRVLPILLDAFKKGKDSYYRLAVVNAIGDLGDKEAAAFLLEILVDDKEFSGARMAAARALGKFGDARAVEPLLQILRDERANKDMKRDAASVLGTFRDRRAVEPLISILINRNEVIWLRVAAASSLGNIGDERAIGPLQEALKDPYIKDTAQAAIEKIRMK
jgi:HEAT repeat protein